MKFAFLHVENVAVVCDDDGHNRDSGLDSEVEGALLEGEEFGLLGVGARAFGEDEDVLALGAHGFGGGVEGSAGGGTVCAVDEYRFGEGHCEAVRWLMCARGLGGTY